MICANVGDPLPDLGADTLRFREAWNRLRKIESDPIEFNDLSYTTQADVLALFDKAIGDSEKENV